MKEFLKIEVYKPAAKLDVAYEAYQVIENGTLVGHVDANGLPIKLPKVVEYNIIDREPEETDWMKALNA